MVTLRLWWSHRWRGLAEWQRALLLTLAGGFVWSHGVPVLGRVAGAVPTQTRAVVAGFALISALQFATARRIDRLHDRVRTHHRFTADVQAEALLRLEVLLSDMSDSVPDGGELRSGSVVPELTTRDERVRSSASTWWLPSFVLVGNALGFFAGLAGGVGQAGSLPVFACSVAGGAVAAGLGLRWRATDEDRDAGSPSSRAGGESSPRGPSSAGGWTGDADGTNLVALGAFVSAASDEFEVEMDEGVLKIRATDRS